MYGMNMNLTGKKKKGKKYAGSKVMKKYLGVS